MRPVPVLFLLACVSCGFPPPPHVGPDDPPPAVDFVISLARPRIHLVEGGSTSVDVTLARTAFSDPVTVVVAGLPDGATADPLTITGDTGALVLHAAPGIVQGEAALTVSASSGAISHDAALSLLAMGLPGTRDKSFAQPSTPLFDVPARGSAVAIQPDGKIVVAGTTPDYPRHRGGAIPARRQTRRYLLWRNRRIRSYNTAG